MAIHRDSPGIEPEAEAETEADRPERQRRFAKLVEASVARRLALPRLTLAVLAIATIVVGIGFVLSWASRSVVNWVASRPDQQLPFASIELVPEPEPWCIDDSKALILEKVRLASKRGETLRLLDLDLKELANDFRVHSPWVKRVVKVEILPGRLRVHLEYRKPAAVVWERDPPVVIDGEGVPLPRGEIKWISRSSPYRVRGISEPLLPITGVDPRSEPIDGIPWQRLNPEGNPAGPDKMLVGAAKIAAFLQNQSPTTPSGKLTLRIVRIWIPDEPKNLFYLVEGDQNFIHWGTPPGDEEVGRPSAETRWKRLLEYVDRHGPLNIKFPQFLDLTGEGVLLKDSTPRQKKKPPGP